MEHCGLNYCYNRASTTVIGTNYSCDGGEGWVRVKGNDVEKESQVDRCDNYYAYCSPDLTESLILAGVR